MRKLCLLGSKFGKLTVISPAACRKNSSYWLCRCDCGCEKEICQTHLIQKRTVTCGCSRLNRNGSKSKWFTGYGEISGSRWSNYKLKAKIRNIEFSLSISDAWNRFLSQNRKCALSGMELKFSETAKGQCTASLDRIDPNKSYTAENIQWVHKDVNWMKNSFGQDYFIAVCKRIAEYQTK